MLSSLTLPSRSSLLVLLLVLSASTACEERVSGNAQTEKTQAKAPPEKKPAAPFPEKGLSSAPPVATGLSPLEIEGHCKTVCEKTASMPCVEVSTCVVGCQETYNLPACRDELGAMLVCTADAPKEGFVCDAEGAPSLKDDRCVPEQERAASCIEKLMRAGSSAENR